MDRDGGDSHLLAFLCGTGALSVVFCKLRGMGKKNQRLTSWVAGRHLEKPSHQRKMDNIAFYIIQNVQIHPVLYWTPFTWVNIKALASPALLHPL